MAIGPAVAPLIGGLVSRYLSWRWMQCLLGLGALTAFLLVFKWLPETIHPGAAGYEKRARNLGEPRRRSVVILNPLESLSLLKSPVLLLAVRPSITLG